jgi:subtilisin-like proprotein convertase family protein
MKKQSLVFALLLLLSGLSLSAIAQTNHALTATAAHTVGGGTTFGAYNYNDGIIDPFSGCEDATGAWGWTTTAGQITYTWASPVTFDKVVFYKADREWTAATLSYWNGTGYTVIANISITTCPVDSISFPPVTTTELRLNNFTCPEGNPAHREIQVWSNPTTPCAAPTAQPTALSLIPGIYNVSGSFTSVASADRYLVVRTNTSTPPSAPVDGVTYSAGSSALGGTIVSLNTDTTFTASGLIPGTTYYFWVFAANVFCTGGPKYNATSPLSGSATTVACSFSGIRTVGPTGDYPTLTAAIAAVRNNGLVGDLALEIQTTYTGVGETLPITIDSIPYCGGTPHTLTIRPQGTLTITAPGDPLIVLNGARNVIIDGRVGSTGTTKSLTISNTATVGSTIVFQNDASNNTVRYCTLRGANTATTDATILFSTTTGTTGNDNNLITNCDILDGTSQPIYSILSLGTTGKENSNNIVTNCNIANYFAPATIASGVFLSTGSTEWTISNNRFYQEALRVYTGTAVQKAISIVNTTGNGFQVTGNIIGYSSAAGTGTYAMSSSAATPFQAILMTVSTAITSTVSGNTITNISYSGTSGLVTGIAVTDGNVDVIGNTIGAATGNDAIVKTNSTTSSPALVGISTSAVTPNIVNILNNNIGGLTTYGSSTTIGAGIYGIQATSTASTTISGNVIGSTTTANSINSATASTGTQLVYGILATISSSTTVPPVISNNTIANINAEGTGTSSFAAGIIFNSTSSGQITGNTIRNISSASANTALTGQAGVSGIVYTGTTGSAAIMQNTINTIIAKNTSTVVSNSAGISLTGSANGMIANNKIFDIRNLSTYTASVNTPPKAIGIFCYSPTTALTIQNNMVSLGNGQTTNTSFTGIMQGGTSSAATIQVYHNTVNIEGSLTTGAMHSVALLRGNYSTTQYTTAFDVRNNILVNNRSGGTGKHYAIANNLSATANATGWGVNASNFNIMNTVNAGTFGYWGADRTFATWKTNSLSDANSYNATPVTFVNTAAGDLHINMGTTPNNIESHATPISGINTDIDNQLRPGPVGSVNGGGLTPDIGADEFDGVPIDNVPPVITHTALLGGCGTGNQNLSALLTDYSGIPTSGTLRPRVYYKKGAAGTWFSQPGTLASGTGFNGTWSFTIVTSDMGGVAVGDQVYYYIIAQDNLAQVGASPSTGLGAANVNSVSTPPTSPYVFNVLNSMNGTYTVGTGGDYTTITAALAAYNAACLAGPVTFSLISTTYSGETFPITITPSAFASATNTLTIKPAAGVAVTIDGSTTAPAVFKLLNAKYVILDGVNSGGASMALNNTNTGSSAVIWLASTSGTGPGNSDITLKNMNINGGISTLTTNYGIAADVDGTTPSATAGMDNDNITIQGNTIQRCYYGIYGIGTVATAAGGLNNWVISGNTIGPATAGSDVIGGVGIYMNNALSVSITNNTVRNVSTTATSTGLIRLNTNVNGFTISGNSLTNSTTSNAGNGTTSFFGVYLGTNVINGSVSGNTISGLSNTNTGGYGVRGIMLNTANSASNDTIVNNMISNLVGLGDASTTAIYAIIGIDVGGATGGVKVYYNSVNLYGDNSGLATATMSMCFFTNTTGGGIELYDNLFENTYNNTSSVLDKAWAIYSTVSSSAFSNIDYNNYFVSGTPGVLGFIAGADQTTLAAIQSSFGGNVNSINADAEFVSPTNLHLAVASANAALIAGTPIPGITTDFDGTVRSGTNPVIGAHEVNIPPCNVALPGTISATASTFCVSGSTVVSVTGAAVGIGINQQWQSSTDSVSWSPIPGATSTSYTTPTITATTYYRFVISCSLSGSKDSVAKKITINPPPSPIVGTGVGICVGGTTTLSTASTGGTWTSSDPSVATITSGGVATGVSVGASKIEYTLPSTGCSTSSYLSIVMPPSAPVITPASTVMCNGNTATLAAVSNSNGASNFTSGTISVAIPDNVATGNYTSLNANLPTGAIITGVAANFNITTTYVGDLNINLTAPNGKTLNLFNMHGGAGVDFVNTTASSAGTTTFASSIAPYTGIYAATAASGDLGAAGYPVNTTVWDSLYGIPNGLWTLSARDNGPADFAFITSWALTLNFKLPVSYAWAPFATLYTDGALTIPYTGTNNDTVYGIPTAPGSVPTATTYTVTTTLAGCATTNATATTVSVNPLPATITGSANLCEGLSYTFNNADAGGTWSSSDAAVASVGSSTGIVNAIVPGTAAISYTFTGTGCSRVMLVTVYAVPAAITGPAAACEGATATLSDATSGGTWVSGSTSVATVGSASGIVTGVSAGFAVITYQGPTGCIATVQATINPLPVNTVAPTAATICAGESVSFTGTSSLAQFSILSQNFNSGLSGWQITNLFGDPLSFWKLTTTPTSGATGDGTTMLDAAPWDYAGTTQTLVTSPSFSTVGYGSAVLSFNQYLFSLISSDPTVDVEYSTDGGTVWNTVLSQVDVTSGTGAWSASAPEVSIALPAGALGMPDVKLRWNYYSNYGLWWDIDNISVKATQPPADPTWAGVGGATGLSCTTCASVDITPAVTGANVYAFTANTTSGCATTTNVTVSVNPLPAAIAGATEVCLGLTTTLSNATLGGTWVSGDAGVASIGSLSGIVTGNAAGTATITYMLPTSCNVTAVVTVHPLPSNITGTAQVCVGLTATLGSTPSGGSWSSSNMSVGTIDAATGVLAGISAGTSIITYTLPTSCITTKIATVNPLPANIGGTLQVCQGSTTTLTDVDAGGTWLSAATANATIGSSTGIVTGVAAGTSEITYTLPTGCITSSVVTVNPLPVAISGPLQVCQGATATLTNGDAGGTWGSGITAIATIGSGTGIVTGVLAGTSPITYTLPTGCITTSVMTVNPLPAPIGGTLQVCEGLTTTLTDADAGGTWVSAVTATATIGSSSGIATGGTAGTTNITYTLPTGCATTSILTVNQTPAAITGTTEICVAGTSTLSSTPTGGAWSSGTAGVATINVISGAMAGVSAGTSVVTYTMLTSCSTVTTVTVNALPNVYSVVATGGGVYCSGAAGVSLALTGSQAGISYQLYNGAAAIGAPVAGTGSPLVFGIYPAGNYSVMATNTATGCQKSMGSTTVTVNPSPAIHNLTGGGSYCSGGTGVAVGLSGSQSGVNYQLYYGSATSGSALSGTGFALNFGLKTGAGAYTVVATNTVTGCVSNMAGSATVSISPVPTAFDVTGGGNYCTGGTGVNVGLSNSQNTVSYQLYNGSSTVGAMLNGTGAALSFGLQTAAGTYSVIANPGSSCATIMNGTVSVSVNPLPAVYDVTGGGSYCTGGTGVHVGLNNSAIGINYQLYNGSTAVGTPVAGTGAALDFGLFTGTGIYSVSANNATTACANNMGGTATIMISATPTAYAVTGGGNYCSGGTGVHIGLANSQSGASYQLYNGATATGSLVTGTGAPLDFGLLAAAGAYSVVANPGSSCATNMTGSVTIGINPSPTAYTVTGGGGYCTGGTGVHVGLSGSGIGINYQLFNGGTPVGSAVAGTGFALDFGLLTTTGTYSVSAVNTVNACPADMTGSTTINIATSVNTYTVTGGGAYCAGGTGTHIGLSASDLGVSYQLYNGATAVGSFIAGTGGAVDFGPITGAGTYTVMANPGSSCATNMSGTAAVAVNALPIAYSMTGGGSYCAGGTGVSVGLGNSETGVAYQLYYSGIPLGTSVAGTGSPISFGAQTMAGAYTVMATSTATCTNAMAGTASININPVLTPSVSVTASANNVCAGTMVTFSTAIVNGGASPVYVWRKNSTVIAGATSSTYAYVPANGDIITGKLISNATCAIPDSATAAVTMVVNPTVIPAATINATPAGHLCPGTSVVLSVATTAAGTAPTYKWVVNSVVVGTGLSHSYIPLDGDIIYFELNSNANCILGDSEVFSNNLLMHVDSAWVPTVSIDVTPGLSIKTGETVTMTAIVSNGGPTPTFQWYKNGIIIPSANAATYSGNTFSNGDSLSCRVTGSGACGYTTFNSVILKVTPVGIGVLSASDIVLVPNPNRGLFTVKGSLASQNDEEVFIEVLNMLGQQVYSGKAAVKNGKLNEAIQLSNTLANGMYMLNLRSGNEKKVFHLVVQQ